MLSMPSVSARITWSMLWKRLPGSLASIRSTRLMMAAVSWGQRSRVSGVGGVLMMRSWISDAVLPVNGFSPLRSW